VTRTGSEWVARPRLPATHYVDRRIYTDEGIFREEQEKIFGRTWILACHESELPAPYDFRTFRHPAGKNLVLVRGPGITFNLRTSVLRIDTAIPLGPNEMLLELRGLGLARDTAEERHARVRDHNTIWGPFGRNLHEDFLAVTGQGAGLGEDPRGDGWLLHGREESATIHDEIGLRHFYAEWSRRMGRSASSPYDDAGKVEP
jgi:hypothetical protein